MFLGCIASAVHRTSSDGVASKPAGYISLCGGALEPASRYDNPYCQYSSQSH